VTKLPEIPKSFSQQAHGFAPFMGGNAARSGGRGSGDLPPLPPPRGGRRPGRRPTWWQRALRIAFAAGAASSLLAAFGLYLWLAELRVFEISDAALDTIVSQRPVDNSLVYDRNGDKIGEFFNSYHVYVPFEQLPKHLVDAIIAIEDRNFWHHAGFDPRGIARAALSQLSGRGIKQGASTLTQQIVRNFALPRERSLSRKVQEIAYAVHLEKRLPKEKILEIYANSLFLGNGSYGAGAAAFRYFGKPLDQLAAQETALIAGLFQSPSRYNPVRNPKAAKARQLQVLKAMQQSGSISLAQSKELQKAPLTYREYQPINTVVAPYFIDYVREEAKKILAELKASAKDGATEAKAVDGQGLRIYTTLDPQVQLMAEQALAESSKILDDAQKKTVPLRTPDGKTKPATVEAAILSIQPQTGEVMAMVGGRDYNKTKFNRTWQAMRSPGSLFKPIVYSLALEKKWKWSDVIFVSPITINNYRPRTPDEDYLTETTLMRAFYRSMNTPTIELGQKLGLLNVVEHAKKLGVRSPVKEEFGTMLGSSDATMFDMARVYGSFANEGTLVEPIAIRKITDRDGKLIWKAAPAKERSQEVMSPQIAYLMTQAMRAVLAMGTGYTSAKLSSRAAGKTGTSNDSTDNWFGGYAQDLVSVVWTGTDEHAQMFGDVTGGKVALPIWDKLMTKYFEAREAKPFRAPPGVVTTVVHPKFGHRSASGVRMYFLKGNEPPDEPSALEALSLDGASSSYRDVFTH
jgi:penicillin-binding protein 1A